MQLPIQIDPSKSLSLQTQLFEALCKLILNSSLAPGARLPATRELSSQLKISRNTVNIVYERLLSEGYIETKPGSGSLVSSNLPSSVLASRNKTVSSDTPSYEHTERNKVNFAAEKPTLFYEGDDKLEIDFRVGRPDQSVFPIKTWRSLAVKNLHEAQKTLTNYNDPLGLPKLRNALIKHLRASRGIRVEAKQVIIVAGVQEALNLISRIFISPKTPVVIESPTYQGAAFTFQSYGATLIPIKTDENGLDIGLLPKRKIKLAYVTPSHQFPLGYTLSLDRRLALLKWARDIDCYIVEDDYDSDFRYQSSPLTALQGLDDNERVIYTSTFSKSLGAGIRLGYMIVPPHLIEAFTTAKALLNNGHPLLDQMILADFIASGSFENHLRRIRKTSMKRRDVLVNSLKKHFPCSRFSGLDGGMHLVWYLPSTLPDASTLQQLMRKQGIGIYSLTLGHAHEFGDTEDRERIILLGYAALKEEQIERGVYKISETIK